MPANYYYIPDLLGKRFDYLQQYEFDLDKTGQQVLIVNGVIATDDDNVEYKTLEEAAILTDNKLKEIIQQQKNIKLLRMPTIDAKDGKYHIHVTISI